MTRLTRSIIPPEVATLEPAEYRAVAYRVICQLWGVNGTTWPSNFKESFGNMVDFKILLDAEQGMEYAEDYRDSVVDTVCKFVQVHEDTITAHLNRVAPENVEQCVHVHNTSTAVVLDVSDAVIVDESVNGNLVPVRAKPFYNPLCLRRIPEYQKRDID